VPDICTRQSQKAWYSQWESLSTQVIAVCTMLSALQMSALQTWFSGSLIPRPFPPPVFDCLQYASTEGKGLGDLVTSGRQWVDTREAVPNKTLSFAISLRAEGQKVSKATSISFIIHSTRDISIQIITSRPCKILAKT